MTRARVKVIFDTNVWISFLIGKHLSKLQSYLSDGRITVITTDQLLAELKLVSQRKKLRKYFPSETVNEFISILEIISENFEITSRHHESRDPKDNFLLDLIDYSKADYLVTGDKDLLDLESFMNAKIVSPSVFEKEMLTF